MLVTLSSNAFKDTTAAFRDLNLQFQILRNDRLVDYVTKWSLASMVIYSLIAAIT